MDAGARPRAEPVDDRLTVIFTLVHGTRLPGPNQSDTILRTVRRSTWPARGEEVLIAGERYAIRTVMHDVDADTVIVYLARHLW